VEFFVTYAAEVFFTDAAMCMNLIVFVQQSDIPRYFLVIEIFCCANAVAFHMPDWKISEWTDRLNYVAK